jgi:HK97 family phage prohead protease
VGKRDYDFAGWVTKNDVKCSDGVTIKHDAFRDNDGQKVPLVWNHDYNSPLNVLGHVLLQHKEQGVYGYGYFNNSEHSATAKEMVRHGDITSMSIGARKLKRSGNDIIHGSIYEVSLVMAGANPGAYIETVVQHSDNGDDEKAHVFTGEELVHSDSEEEKADGESKKDEQLQHAEEKTIEDVINTMNDEQKEAVAALLGMVTEAGDEDDSKDKKEPPSDDKKSDDELKQADDETKKSGEELKQQVEETKKQSDDEKGDEEVMKHNVFNGKGTGKEKAAVLSTVNDVLKHAQALKASSFKDMLAAAEVKTTNTQGEEVIQHGINSIEMLFPEAATSTNGNVPILFNDSNTAYEDILNGVSKSPFSRVKTLVADVTEEEARAKGYIKGNMKKEEFFSLIKRTTTPATVYKKQKLDRDDIIDITDFDVVAFMNVEMQMMLKEEIARAILVGDGRDFSDEDKISEQNIRPIISDHEFFTIHKTFADAAAFIESVIRAMAEYRGSGRPNMYVDPTLLASVKLLKANDGRFLFGDIPSDEAVANRLGLSKIVPTTFMTGKGALIVNLRDYQLGASKGGQITNFDDFDIDFNQYKYLIETRLSGALTQPKSAIHLQEGATPGAAANDADGGLTYGSRSTTTTSTTTLA